MRAVVRFDYTPACTELNDIPTDKKLVLITGHRRENFGKPLRNVIEALRQLSQDGDKCLVFPVHLNPNVRRTVFAHLTGCENIRLLDPLQYPDFVYLMERCWAVVTDSGGIQEEAPSFHRPILITREVTERPEVLDAGFGELVGTDTERLVKAVSPRHVRRDAASHRRPQSLRQRHRGADDRQQPSQLDRAACQCAGRALARLQAGRQRRPRPAQNALDRFRLTRKRSKVRIGKSACRRDCRRRCCRRCPLTVAPASARSRCPRASHRRHG